MMSLNQDVTSSRRYCSVMGCGTRGGKMFYFPRSSKRREDWKVACKIQRVITDSMVICVRHFRQSEITTTVNGRLRLKSCALPSLHLPCSIVKKSRRNCVVHGCAKGSSDDISLHYFPKCPDRRSLWQRACKLSAPPTRNSVICSRHFLDRDFKNIGNSERKILKTDALPTLHLPGFFASKCEIHSPRQWNVPCECLASVEVAVDEPDASNHSETLSSSSDSARTDFTSLFAHECGSSADLNRCSPIYKVFKDIFSVFGEGLELRESSIVQDTSCQLSESNRVRNVENNVDSSSCVQQREISFSSAFTAGVSGSSQSPLQRPVLLDLLFDDFICQTFTGVTLSLLDSLSLLCLKLGPYLEGRKMPVKEMVVMSLCKLHLNLSFKSLSGLFKVSDDLCRCSFQSTIFLLAHILKSCVKWPSREEILVNLPYGFRKFKDARVILDTVKISVHSPQCLQCYLEMRTLFHRELSLKLMLGIAPHGPISYCSAVYGEEAADEKIFVESNLVAHNMLDPHSDALIVGGDFQIRNVCKEKHFKVYSAPSKNVKWPSNSFKTKYNVISRAAKVSFQQVVQKMKCFRILEGSLCWSMVPFIDSIITIIAALINLRSDEDLLPQADCLCLMRCSNLRE